MNMLLRIKVICIVKWGRRKRFSCKCVYVINFFHSLKIKRNKVNVDYSHSQIIYLPHTVKEHKLNSIALRDVVFLQHFLIAVQ